MSILSWQDVALTPVYVFVIYQFLFWIRKKECGKSIIKKYFIPAATAKIIGAISLGLIYRFYYKGGDTTQFYLGSTILNNVFMDDPLLGIITLFRNCKDRIPVELIPYFGKYMYINDNSSFFVVRIGTIFGLIDFNTYSITAIFFGMISLSGSWALYRVLYNLYPALHKNLAIAVFFLPSVIFWGSGFMKDTLTFGALGWFFYGFYHITISRKKLTKPIIALAISMFVLAQIKIYILMSLIPALLVWLFLEYNQKIKSTSTRILLLPFLLLISLLLGLFATRKIAEEDKQYRFENLTFKAKETNEWLSYVSKTQKGSYYSLGEIDYSSPLSMLKSLPKAVNVSLFRPYLWEVRNPVMLMAALESMFFLFFTLKTILKIGPKKILSIIKNNPIVLAFMIFSIGMAFAVGLTSANFGTLVRYKIPLLPFYIASLFIIEHVYSEEKRIKKEERLKKLQIEIANTTLEK